MSEEEREYTRELIGSTKSVIKFLSSGAVASTVYLVLADKQMSSVQQLIVTSATIACVTALLGCCLAYRVFIARLKQKVEK